MFLKCVSICKEAIQFGKKILIFMKQNIFLGIDFGATKTIFLLVRFEGKKFKILESIKTVTSV